MEKRIVIVCMMGLCMALGACKEKGATFVGPVQFKQLVLNKDSVSGTASEQINYKVSIRYYMADSGPGILRDSINAFSTLFLARWLKVSSNDQFDLHAAVDANLRAFIDHVQRNVPEQDCGGCRTYELRIEADSIFQNQHVFSIAYNWQVYEGGPRGNLGKWCVMIDKNDGSRVTYPRLVKDEAGLLMAAEKAFRLQNGLKADEALDRLYSFNDNRFHLSSDFAFTSKGLVFYYNPFQIAPYTMGIIRLELPYSEVAQFVNFTE